MEALNNKINQHFAGKVVRKDLTKLIKGNAIVPSYVLEYLLGQYCATDDDETINAGVETVKGIIQKHFVHRDEAEIIKSAIREKGSHRIIDKISVELNDKQDRYEATFSNLGLRNIPTPDDIVKQHKKLLGGGVWCILTVGYMPSEERNHIPWIIENLKPIQISGVDVEEYKAARGNFSKDEWVDLLIQSIGLNPEEFSFRSKLLQLMRLVPFVENNYNLIELGPKGTGKSHIYSELSPHGILISGGEVTKAKLFVNNSTGSIGLVGYWDVVAYDEFAGKTKRTDRGLVDIMKNYMANKSFSRGTDVLGASASMVFVGNTDHTVSYMMKHSDLFEALPKDYYDTAFLDRLHAYIPGWEVDKLRNEMFSDGYGFIVDYLAEVLRILRKEDYGNDYSKYFELSSTITTRDKTAISKTFGGLVKLIYPDQNYTQAEAQELLDISIENRKRVKEQLRKMDETFEAVDFNYKDIQTGELFEIYTLEEEEYLNKTQKPTTKPIVGASEEVVKDSVEETQSKFIESLQPGQKKVRDNQAGISYANLFGAYLVGATDIKLIDPYIRAPYQMRNFMEFAKLISDLKGFDEEVKLHLVTYNEEIYLDKSAEAFDQMQQSLEEIGIDFTYELDETAHDRSIVLNNGWKIVLGRGLDIFQRTGGWYSMDEYVQEYRKCKASEITFVEISS